MKIDGLIPGISTAGMKLNNTETSLLDRLQPGDTIKAEILDIKMGEAVLRLADGSAVKAASIMQLQAEAGDFVTFVLKEKINGKILLETLKPDMIKSGTKQPEMIKSETVNQVTLNLGSSDSGNLQENKVLNNKPPDIRSTGYIGLDDGLKQVLKGINMESDASSLQLAKAMLDQGLPVNRESFEAFKKLISEFPEISSKKVIFLLANGLEPSEENIKMLNQIADGKLKSGDLIQKISNSIEHVLELQDNNELISKILEDIKGLPVSIREAAPGLSQQDINEIKKQIIEKITPENLLPGELEKLQIIRRNLPSIPSPFKEEILSIVGELEKSIDFYNEVSKQHYFYQIPLCLSEKTATGELYVLKNRGGAKRFDKNSLTAFLSLETENMGVIDAYVNMSAKTVEIQFRAENTGTVEKIREYTIGLYRVFNEKGYRLADCSCRLKEAAESVIIVDAGEKAKIPWLLRGRPLDIKV